MTSGDNQPVADAVAKSVGLTEDRGDLMPEPKVKAIEVLRETHGKVAMVGDGVNDAPAMAKATVGIAMGALSLSAIRRTLDPQQWVHVLNDELQPRAVPIPLRPIKPKSDSWCNAYLLQDAA